MKDGWYIAHDASFGPQRGWCIFGHIEEKWITIDGVARDKVTDRHQIVAGPLLINEIAHELSGYVPPNLEHAKKANADDSLGRLLEL